MNRLPATLADVARASGVSTATVSYVLNRTDGHRISPATTQRVLEAAASLGYVPNHAAQALRSGTSRIVILDVDVLPANVTVERFIQGVDAELSEHNLVLLVHHGHLSASTLQEVERATSARTVISLRSFLEGAVDPRIEATAQDFVRGSEAAVQARWLLERGYRRLAYAQIAAPALEIPANGRAQAFSDAVESAGHSRPITFTVPDDPQEADRVLSSLLDRHRELDAIAAYNDDVALLLLAALRRLEVAVPQRVAVMGFDDTPAGRTAYPSLTTVAVDAFAYGRRAARMGLELPPDPAAAPRPPEVIGRDSA